MTPRTIPIALTLADGSVAIMHYVVEGRFSGDVILKMVERGDLADVESIEDAPDAQVLVRRTASDASIQLEIARGPLASRVVSWRRVELTELPTDRRYRASWRDFGDGVRIDLAKARGERLDVLRKERVQALELLDREWMRATGQEKQAEARAIELTRQKLRDMPQLVSAALEAAQTADELDAVGLP